MPRPKLRASYCPGCRRPRNVRIVGNGTVGGARVDLARCPDTGCELVWALRPATA